jgi:hypothetical protein
MSVTITTTPTLRGIAHTGGLLDELIAYWPCNEGIGTTITDVHAGYTGDLSAGGASFSGSSKLGSYCVESDSYSDYITFGTADMFKNVYDKISISYWIKVDTLPSVLTSYTYQVYITADASNSIIGIYHNTDNRLYFYAQSYLGEAATKYAYSTVLTDTTNFYMITCVAGGIGTDYKIYINGVDNTQYSTTQTGPIYPYYYNTHYLMNNGGIRGIDGRMDEIAFYSKALSSTDVLNLYNDNLGIAYPFIT